MILWVKNSKFDTVILSKCSLYQFQGPSWSLTVRVLYTYKKK